MVCLVEWYSKTDIDAMKVKEYFLTFINKNNYTKEIIEYQHILQYDLKEQTKNGFFNEEQRQYIISQHRNGMSIDDIHKYIVTPWWEQGKLNKLWTTHYKYKYNLPSKDSIKKLCNNNERFLHNIMRNIRNYFIKLNNPDAFKKYDEFYKYWKGYVNAPTKELNIKGTSTTGIISTSIPGVFALALDNYRNGFIQTVYRGNSPDSRNRLYLTNEQYNIYKPYLKLELNNFGHYIYCIREKEIDKKEWDMLINQAHLIADERGLK